MQTRQKIALKDLIRKLGEIDASGMSKYQIHRLNKQVNEWKQRVGLLWLTPEEKQECDAISSELSKAWEECLLRNPILRRAD